MKRLEGKVAIVTGGASGMGRATVMRFLADGAKVVVASRRTDQSEETVRLIKAAGGEALPAGALTERYVRRVERQIHAAPADWPWSHKRWKLKKSVYQSHGRTDA